jgi:hypothetical protein
MITIKKARQKLQRKIRKVSDKALPNLLAVGTGAAPEDKLDGVIDGLERKLCKTMAKGYPKVLAAGIVETGRSIAPVSPIPISEEAPNSTMKSEPMTDEKLAAKARKKAIKAKRKAELAEASAAEARERLNKGAYMDNVITIAKAVISGKPSAFTKRDFFLELQKRADENRQPGETREGAFTRYATTAPDGRLLMQAHKFAGGEDYCGEADKAQDEPLTNEPYQRLMDLANKKRKKDETVEQAFACLYADPKYQDLVTTEKRRHNVQVAKAMGLG